MNMMKPSEPLTVTKCRETNQTQQYKQPIWQLLQKLADVHAESQKLHSNDQGSGTEQTKVELELSKQKSSEAVEKIRKYFRELKASNTEIFTQGPVGPVGEYPIHICFLLGLKDLGMELVKNYYNTPKLINIGYQDDLQPYKAELVGRKSFDCGLYTGETILHIAIVTCDKETVEFLLRHGASLDSRAIGVFFLPPWIPPREKQSAFQKIKSRLLSFATSEINKHRNEYSQVTSHRSCAHTTLIGV